MIGTVKIPLASLIQGSSINERFSIRNAQNESVGTLEAKISIIDIDNGGFTSFTNNRGTQMHYNKQWENDLIYKISKRLAKFPGEIEMLFGIFSKGQKTVTKEDFKYTLMRRLQLRNEISEKEIDMFLKGCHYIIDKEYVSLDDFIQIFSSSVNQARQDILDEEALQIQTIKRYEDMQRQQSLHQKSFMESEKSLRMSYKEDEFARSGSNVFKDPNILGMITSSSRTNLTLDNREVIEILT